MQAVGNPKSLFVFKTKKIEKLKQQEQNQTAQTKNKPKKQTPLFSEKPTAF